MSKPVPVVETHKNEEGEWVAESSPVSTSEDIDTIDTLEGLTVVSRTVLVQDQAKDLTVYTDGETSWILYEDAFL